MKRGRLYEQDETAWLEQTARLLQRQEYSKLDVENLAEYLQDMARRDRRDVFSRLVTLMIHLLKWDYQPERRSRSWKATIKEQTKRLRRLLARQTLWQHAAEVLAEAYADAVEQAAIQTGLSEETFPKESPYLLDDLLET